MRFFVFLVGGLFLASGISLAQPLEGKQAKQIVHMQDQLGLTDEQIGKIREIDSQGGGPGEIRSVLTQDQLSQLQERRLKQKRNKEKQRDRMDAMQKELDLSDSQMEQIREISARGSQKDQIMALLTDAQKVKMKDFRKKYDSENQGHANCIAGLQAALGLSNDQEKEIRNILAQGSDREAVLAVIMDKQ